LSPSEIEKNTLLLGHVLFMLHFLSLKLDRRTENSYHFETEGFVEQTIPIKIFVYKFSSTSTSSSSTQN
jgi:hypothetical protein